MRQVRQVVERTVEMESVLFEEFPQLLAELAAENPA